MSTLFFPHTMYGKIDSAFYRAWKECGMVTLTSKAIAEIKRIRKERNHPEETGLRLAVAGGGCSGFSYQITLESKPNPEDTVLEQEDLKIFIDPRSALYLNGVSIDYVELAVGSGFKFNNPNATGTCGCGESFTV